MAFNCAHCKGKHDLADEGRKCAGIKPDARLTLPQQKYLASLLGQFMLMLDNDYTVETVPLEIGQPILSALENARWLKATGKSYNDMPRGVIRIPHPMAITERVPTRRQKAS